MINLLYHSHTIVASHLEELLSLGLLEHDEHVLVALDGVLVDESGLRLSGPTLHDYCLLTSLRMLLWARNYGDHLCYAFPLAELALVEGAGLDPLHAQLAMTFTAEGEEDQRFTLTLMPLTDLHPALSLLSLAAESARLMAVANMPRHEAGPEMVAVLSEQIYGSVDGPPQSATPYRWPGAPNPAPVSPAPAFQQNPANLPPEQFYAAGRLARSAWDTLKRSLNNSELPFDLNTSSLRDLTDTVRAINDLVQTMSSNPSAQELAMAFIKSRSGQAAGPAVDLGQVFSPAPAPAADVEALRSTPEPDYHEIPLRRRGEPAKAQPTAPMPATEPTEQGGIALRQRGELSPPPPSVVASDRGSIPLRRRGAGGPPSGVARAGAPMSGSGDAGHKEE